MGVGIDDSWHIVGRLRWTGRVMGETFGFDATGMGDVDGDGAIDFLVTSAWSAKNGAKSGRVYILAGPTL